MIEVQAVHLGADDVVVHLLGDWPCAWIDGGEACLITRESFLLRGHRARGVVGDAVLQRGPLKRAPLGEEREQILVACACRSSAVGGGASCIGGLGRAATSGGQRQRQEDGDAERARKAGSRHGRHVGPEMRPGQSF